MDASVGPGDPMWELFQAAAEHGGAVGIRDLTTGEFVDIRPLPMAEPEPEEQS